MGGQSLEGPSTVLHQVVCACLVSGGWVGGWVGLGSERGGGPSSGRAKQGGRSTLRHAHTCTPLCPTAWHPLLTDAGIEQEPQQHGGAAG